MNIDLLIKAITDQVTPEEFIEVMDLDIDYLVYKFADEIAEHKEKFDYLDREEEDV